MTHLFIINPAAGQQNRTAEFCEQIDWHCAQHHLMYRVEISRGPGDCTRIAREAAESGQMYRIYACGGDGTLNEIVQGAAGYDNVQITVYSGGTGNDFVKIFNEPEAFTDLSRLVDVQVAEFDLIECNGELCQNICSIGLDARIGVDVVKYKHIPFLNGFQAYVVSTVWNVLRGVSESYVVEVGQEVLEGEQTLICVCNGRYYGGGYYPVPEADPTDGLLDVLVVKKVSRLLLATVIGKYKNGQYTQLPRLVRHYRVPEIRIRCAPDTVIELDGEGRKVEQMYARIADKKLRFAYPAGLTWQPEISKE